MRLRLACWVPSGMTVSPANGHNMIRTKWGDRTLFRSSVAGGEALAAAAMRRGGSAFS
jgi:hypothetical protein